MSHLPKNLVLDCKTWRCGFNGKNHLGTGSTMLKNNKGFSCCLGQFIQQCHPDLDIDDSSEPFEVVGLRNKTLVDHNLCNTKFSVDAMNINDNVKTTVKEKIRLLRILLRKYSRKLIVKNLKAVS